MMSESGFAPRCALGSLVLLGMACLVAIPFAAPLVEPDHAAHIDEARDIVRRIQQEHRIPGVAVAVWKHDRLIWAEGFGQANLEHDVPVNRTTRFRLGSVSKIFTASLTAKLAADGLVDLDVDIRTYLSSFPDKGDPITLRQLLGHLGGIRHYAPKDYDLSAPGGSIDQRLYPTTEEALAIFADDPLVSRPGKKYAYSTFGYTLVSAVLEAATGTPFLQLLEERLLTPLELESVRADEPLAIIPGRTGYYHRGNNTALRHAIPVNPAYKWAGGGLLASASDLARFGGAHLGVGFFSAQTLAQLFRPQKDAKGEFTCVGLGWRIDTDPQGRTLLHHAGTMPGTRAVLMLYPDPRVAVAFLSNLTGTPRDVEAVAQEIAAPFLEEVAQKDVVSSFKEVVQGIATLLLPVRSDDSCRDD